MRFDFVTSVRWRESGRRIAVIVVVIGGHLGLLMLLLHGKCAPWHELHEQVGGTRHVITLRYIETARYRPNSRSTPMVAVAVKTAAGPRRRVPATIRSVPAPDHSVTAAPGTATTTRSIADTNAGPGYISSGNLLRGAELNRSSGIRLPGSGVAIVPGIHMLDPRTQGLAGVARALQALLGVPDTHCVKVDAWRTLSTREMLERHISPGQVQKTAEEYGCLPKP